GKLNSVVPHVLTICKCLASLNLKSPPRRASCLDRLIYVI
ncbi:MAG: hypothetical protein RL310_508, partial [Actinomycetota bacterium]